MKMYADIVVNGERYWVTANQELVEHVYLIRVKDPDAPYFPTAQDIIKKQIVLTRAEENEVVANFIREVCDCSDGATALYSKLNTKGIL